MLGDAHVCKTIKYYVHVVILLLDGLTTVGCIQFPEEKKKWFWTSSTHPYLHSISCAVSLFPAELGNVSLLQLCHSVFQSVWLHFVSENVELDVRELTPTLLHAHSSKHSYTMRPSHECHITHPLHCSIARHVQLPPHQLLIKNVMWCQLIWGAFWHEIGLL